MSSSLPNFEQRLSNLQEQMDRLRPAPGREFGPAEQQLVLLTDQCAEIVRRWALTSERHARAVGRFETHLSEWNDAGVRLQQDASQRIQELEKVVQHEWEELRDLHAEPVRQLHEHATNLTQVCIATANAAQQNFERSEARLAAIELEFDRRMTELTREIQTAVAELRSLHQSAGSSLPSASAVQAWPLEGVTRLHNQLRRSEAGDPTGLEPLPSMIQRPVAGALPEASVFSERLETLERSLGERNTNMRAAAQQTARVTRTWRAAVAMLALVVVTSALVTWRLWEAARDADERAVIAQKAATAATDAAARDVAATREATARDMKSLVDRAAHAQTMVDVLAAPDLIRYNLAGRDFLTGASAQVHWSRSSGVVFRGLRMLPPPTATTYQLWLLTRAGAAVGVATFAPDASGAATVAIPPPQVTRAVVGAVVTLEPAAGSQAPSGSAVLARPPEPDPSPSIQ